MPNRSGWTDFVTWYNHAHRHAGIGLHTPAEVHHGRHHRVRANRQATLATARAVMNARAWARDANRSGKTGAYFSVLKLASMNGLMLL
ncbi:hypothetical protein [Salinispora pacifica]|uniref:hypothetical protein n=1 Tax=Salinispora pacifica TaxID=351187 RepID=UPI0004B93D71